ncbi:MAG: tyrosine-type recombinase/integrase [Rhodocyclaceae bacterium]|nr:tyrosine-type recombinase/integrase [Rhodocyclaceae bacterium]
MAVQGRKIGRHHLALYRGWLQGVSLKTLADRYLETGVDLRIAKTTLTWIRDTIRQAALRNGKHGEARLLRLSLSTAETTRHVEIPTLEDFQADRDPSGFYSEDELIRLFLESYPQAADKKSRQRQKLIGRQIETLVWVEQLLATDPVPEDLVSAWFDEVVANRLILADIPSIGALLDRIRRKGYRWWITVPKLGEKGASRIIQWLRGYESALGSLPEHTLSPLRTLAMPALLGQRITLTAIVPIEALAVPDDIDGATGSNRWPGTPRINALNDHQAIQAWLATKSGNTNTQRAYRKEAERMLLWAIIERGKALSDLTVDDCTRYRDWLSLLGCADSNEWNFNIDQSAWIAPRNTQRFSPDWRPFDGALSASSVKHSITIVGGLFEWLVRVQYCAFNPWDGVGKTLAMRNEIPDDIELTRVFSSGQWEFLMGHLASMDPSDHTKRLQIALPFAHATGLRLSELVDAKLGRLYTMPVRDGTNVRWMLKVLGKGAKWRAVPISERILALLSNYLEHRKLDPDPLANPSDTPLLARINGIDPISSSGLYKALRGFFQDAALSLHSLGKKHDATAFERASVHWLRHTCGSHMGSSGVPVNLIQKLLGHASVATTSIYTESDAERLWLEVTDLEENRAD